MIFESISNKFQLRLKDRANAANILGEALRDVIGSRQEQTKDTFILGIPRGGVVIADIIARKLSCKFDIIIPRKLRAPHNEELAIGAIMEDGTTYLNEVIVKELGIPSDFIEEEKARQLEEIKRRSALYYASTPRTDVKINLNDKNVVLADDGAATGATLIAASRWIRATYKPSRFMIAIPVAPKDTVNLLKRESIDHIEVITSPSSSNFRSVGQYYQSFQPVSEKQVIQIMRVYKLT